MSDEEIKTRGEAIYDQSIKPFFEPARNNEVAAIDVLSGDYAIASGVIEAAELLRAKHPDAVVWLRRIGSPCLYRIRAGRQEMAAS